MAYTPGLKIKEVFTVRKTRRLPMPGKVLVQKGDAVHSDSEVAETQIPGDVIILQASSILGVEPKDINLYVVKGEERSRER